MSILVVGTVAFDHVKTPFDERANVLAGAATYFAIAASFFTQVSIVGIVGNDFTAEHERIFDVRGIDLSGLERRKDGKSFRWTGEYGYDFNTRTTLDTQLNVFADFQPRISPAQQEIPYLFLGNAHPSLQRDVRQQSRARLTAMDTMDFWIQGTPNELRETLRCVDLLIINDEEARQLARDPNIIRAAKAIMALGPKRLIVKRGEYGATLFGEDSFFAIPGFPQENVVDPTGAGDTFAGGVMGYLAATGSRLDEESLRKAMIYGSVMASFTIEAFGTERLLALTREEINERYRQFKTMTYFDGIEHSF
ncbi:sugar kinase [Chloracidobacterium sp. MS 40/45]|uniref:PfkB family carbohydrate kinase n=1 Tax=Chloracidobacterium aggregatum TaxID=2851959 RepID=UPI001B8D33F8|nr:PfkB family carbohydrate kinase [Chloracidobacterium aggregatum]QUW00010.1 sugar kinase [Chloracidobacterium sp. MS 40/45]